MSATPSAGRAAVPATVLETVRARGVENVELVTLTDGLDLETIDFLVPSSTPDLVDRLPQLHRLSVVQVLSAGTDWIEDRLPRQATLCNARGARDGPVAEWILGALLGASTGQFEFTRTPRWDRSRHPQDLGSWSVVIVGMGSIGRQLATYLAPLGTRIIGVGSHAHDDLHGPDQLAELLPQADAVVVIAPLSDSTRGLIGSGELRRMRDGALLVNAGRGAVVDAAALTAELGSGRLRAVLDVVDPEPLPETHPLWQAPGLLCLTPHIAGDSPAGNARAAELAADQLTRWSRGEQLLNVVRPAVT